MRRNIYIREEDEAMFEKAEKLAESEESLSSIIASALREWVESREVITIQPGFWPGDREPFLERAISFRSIFKEEIIANIFIIKIEPSIFQLYVTEGGNFVAVAIINKPHETKSDIPDHPKIVKATVYSDIDEIPFVEAASDWDYEDAEKTFLPYELIDKAKYKMGKMLKPRWID